MFSGDPGSCSKPGQNASPRIAKETSCVSNLESRKSTKVLVGQEAAPMVESGYMTDWCVNIWLSHGKKYLCHGAFAGPSVLLVFVLKGLS